MKIHEYNEMMSYLTRPAMAYGGRINFGKGGKGASKAPVLTWENLTKDPLFEQFWKEEIDIANNPSSNSKRYKNAEIYFKDLKRVIDKYKTNDPETIFNNFRAETRDTESIMRRPNFEKNIGRTPLLTSRNHVDNLVRKFKNVWKTDVSPTGQKLLNIEEFAEKIGYGEKQLRKMLAARTLDYPAPVDRFTLRGIETASNIHASQKFFKSLEDAGIKVTFPKDVGRGFRGVKGGMERLAGKIRIEATPEQIEKFKLPFAKMGKDFFDISPDDPLRATKQKDFYSSLSKDSAEYKKFGYSKDKTAVLRLKKALNNTLRAMSTDKLVKFINKNPKLKHIVEMTFNPKTLKFERAPVEDLAKAGVLDNYKQQGFFEVDHIMGRSTVEYDPATRKLLSGLNLEYPKNLYIIPKGLNQSTKQIVENFVAANPDAVRPGSNSPLTSVIKNIDKTFKDAGLSYWDRVNNIYRGAEPSASAVGTSHLGLENEIEKILSNKKTFIDNSGVERRIIDNGDKLIESLKKLAEIRGESADTIQKHEKLIRNSIKNVPTGKGKVAAGIAVGVLAPVLTGLGIDQVEAAEPGQMPQGSPGQLSEDQGLSLQDKAALGTVAVAGAKPAWKYALKPALKIMGSPAAGLAFGGWSFVDKFNASKAETEEGKVYDALTEGIKLGEGEDEKEILGSQVGMKLLFPEVVKRGAKKLGVEFSKKGAQNALAALGRFALNPIGRAASIMTPTGLTLNAAAVAKRYYDFAKDEMERLEQMKPEERKAYNEMLMDETYSADAGDYYTSEDVLAGKPVGYNQGGRVGFDEGSKPKSPGRRVFLKGITALAALPLVGRFFKMGEVLERAQPYLGPTVEKIKGMPEWFPALVKKLYNEGEDVTKQMSFKDRQIVKRGELEGGDKVDLYYDLDTGNVNIDVTPKKGGYETTSGAYNKEYSLEYTKGQADEMTKGKKPPDEFGVAEIEGRMDQQAMDVDWEGKMTTVDDALTDLTELEAFAKNKTTTQIHKKKKTKPKDVFPDYDYNPLDDY